MTKKEEAIITAYIGILIGELDEAYKYIDKILGRSILTHELASKFLWEEIKKKARPDLEDLKIEG